jgi:RNA polymerase II-associated factor 1
VEQEVPNEFLLVLDDGPDNDLYGEGARKKGAYYKNIERKMQLKKKRAAVCIWLFMIRSLADQC